MWWVWSRWRKRLGKNRWGGECTQFSLWAQSQAHPANHLAGRSEAIATPHLRKCNIFAICFSLLVLLALRAKFCVTRRRIITPHKCCPMPRSITCIVSNAIWRIENPRTPVSKGLTKLMPIPDLLSKKTSPRAASHSGVREHRRSDRPPSASAPFANQILRNP